MPAFGVGHGGRSIEKDGPAALFLLGKRRFSARFFVEFGIGTHEGALVLGQCFAGQIAVDLPDLLDAERPPKQRWILRVAAQSLFHFGPGGGHFHGISHRMQRLFLQRHHPAVPKQPFVIIPHIDQTGRTAQPFAAKHAVAQRLAVGESQCRQVAGSAGNAVVLREDGIEKQAAAQFHARYGHRIVFRHDHGHKARRIGVFVSLWRERGLHEIAGFGFRAGCQEEQPCSDDKMDGAHVV